MKPNNVMIADPYKRLGIGVRFFRTQRKMTQEELSEKANISLSFLGHIERATRKSSLETFDKLVHALDCSADELLGTGKQNRKNLILLLQQLLEQLSDEDAE